MNKYFVFADAHVQPDTSLDHLERMGNLVVNARPEYIVNLGDFGSYDSLSHWDVGKPKLMEGRRIARDLRSVTAGLYRFFLPIIELQEKQRHDKKRVYRPTIIWCDGNHEDRVARYVEHTPVLEDVIPTQLELFPEELDYRVIHHVPYKDYVTINGISFTHAPITANAQAVSGKYALHRALEPFNTHIVFGHLHRYEIVNKYKHGTGGLQQAISCGCSFLHELEYSKGAANDYFKCCMLLTQRNDGLLDTHTFTLN